MIDKLLAEVRKRKAELEQAVFISPPSDFAGFQNMLGRWLELNETESWAADVLRKLDEDEERDS